MTDDSRSEPVRPLSPAALARLVDLAEDAIVSVDEAHRIVLFNRGAEKTFGYAATEVLGRPLDLLIPARFTDAHRAHVRAFADAPADARVMGDRRPVFGVRKDGTEFPAEATISRFTEGGRLFFNAIVRDVTDRVLTAAEIRAINQDLEARVRERTAELRAATQQLWQAAKLASVGELAAGIAHELNNPLGTISLRVEGVLARTPEGDPRRAALEVVEGEVERMARLIANLLQFSRRAEDQVSTVDVAAEVVTTAELVEHHLRRRGIGATFDVREGVPPVLADRQKLRQVFLNLYTNAADAMPGGGTMTTRVYPYPCPGGGAGVGVEVADTGVGIPADVLPRVTDPFFTTKEEGKGTGLGLAICRRIVADHQGTLTIDSAVGAGTTVRITLPADGRRATAGDAPPS